MIAAARSRVAGARSTVAAAVLVTVLAAVLVALVAALLVALLGRNLAPWPGAAGSGSVGGPVPQRWDPAVAGGLTVEVPRTVVAGTPASVHVTGASGDDPVELLVVSAAGATQLSVRAVDGSAIVDLPRTVTTAAGRVDVRARSGYRVGDSWFRVRPASPVSPLEPLAGPRAVVADGRHWTMVTVVPQDRFGNPVPEGTSVRMRFQRPGEKPRSRALRTAGLVAASRIWSSWEAGVLHIAVATGRARGPLAQVQQVPGPPMRFRLRPVGELPVADGRSLIEIVTRRLVDRFGNTLLDGTTVSVAVADPDGTVREISGVTVGGRARMWLQAPTTPGVLALRPTAAGTTGATMRIRLAPDASARGVRARVVGEGDQAALRVGPLRGRLGAFVPDGHRVRVSFPGRVLRALTVRGYVVVRLSPTRVEEVPGRVRVWVGARSWTVRVGGR